MDKFESLVDVLRSGSEVKAYHSSRPIDADEMEYNTYIVVGPTVNELIVKYTIPSEYKVPGWRVRRDTNHDRIYLFSTPEVISGKCIVISTPIPDEDEDYITALDLEPRDLSLIAYDADYWMHEDSPEGYYEMIYNAR